MTTSIGGAPVSSSPEKGVLNRRVHPQHKTEGDVAV